jgi:hypothetical protein
MGCMIMNLIADYQNRVTLQRRAAVPDEFSNTDPNRASHSLCTLGSSLNSSSAASRTIYGQITHSYSLHTIYLHNFLVLLDAFTVRLTTNHR